MCNLRWSHRSCREDSHPGSGRPRVGLVMSRSVYFAADPNVIPRKPLETTSECSSAAGENRRSR